MDSYTQLAKQTIENNINFGSIIDAPDNLPAELYTRRAGVFVTIFNGPNLRGCIGTYLPTRKNIAEEIINNAISACSADFRFSEITKNELPELNYEVSILSTPQPVDDINKLDPKKYGVIVKSANGRCGLLLPNLDGIDSVDQQISIASRKGGINPEKDKIQIECFTVEKHK